MPHERNTGYVTAQIEKIEAEAAHLKAMLEKDNESAEGWNYFDVTATESRLRKIADSLHGFAHWGYID